MSEAHQASVDMTKQERRASLRSNRTWEIAYDDTSTQRGSQSSYDRASVGYPRLPSTDTFRDLDSVEIASESGRREMRKISLTSKPASADDVSSVVDLQQQPLSNKSTKFMVPSQNSANTPRSAGDSTTRGEELVISASPRRDSSSLCPQQQQSDWFLLHWLSVFTALWLSLFSWLGRCIGIRTYSPLPELPSDTRLPDQNLFNENDSTTLRNETNTVSSELGGARTSMSRATSSLWYAVRGPILPGMQDAAISADAKLNLENFCLLLKQQLMSKEIVVTTRDRKKLEKKCDYLLQWVQRNPDARQEDYVKGLDDVMCYSTKLIGRGPTLPLCSVM